MYALKNSYDFIVSISVRTPPPIERVFSKRAKDLFICGTGAIMTGCSSKHQRGVWNQTTDPCMLGHHYMINKLLIAIYIAL